MRKQTIILILTIGYIGFGKYSRWKQEKDLERFQQGLQQGLQQGFEQAIIQVVQQATTCQQVPLRVENQTINIIAVECLQQWDKIQ